MLLGSVTRAVVHHAGVPVLIARVPESRQGPIRALVACDRTGISVEAIEFVRRLCWPSNTTAHLLHVKESALRGPIPDWFMEEMRQSQSKPVTDWMEEDQRASKESVDELAIMCRNLPPPFQNLRPVVQEGHPGEWIIETIASNKINLVIVGARIQGTLGRMLSGSTSEYIFAHANCSVFVVPYHDAP